MISVCMAVYNGAQFIKEQMDSILPQLAPDDELIVSDDNSDDNTLEILRQFNDTRIKIVHHIRDFSKRKNAAGYYCSNNFSNAIQMAKGDIIFLSDQDDVWYEEKVKKILKVLEKNDLCMSNFSIINENGEVLTQKYFKHNPLKHNWFSNFNKNVYFGCCMAFRKDSVKQFMPIPISIPSYDNWIGTILHLTKKKVLFIEEPLVFYRRHTMNISPATGKSKNPMWFKIFWRAQFLFNLIKHFANRSAKGED